jgi:hypothetical protein
MKTLLALGLLIFSGCVDQAQTVVVDDVSKEQKQLLISKQKNPHAVRLKVKGQTDGSFNLLGLDFKGGIIDDSYLVDWYSDTLIFHYKPVTATSGHLKVQCDF